MSEIQQIPLAQIKICVMGGKMVGKTHLSRQLSNQVSVQQYTQKTEVIELSQINHVMNIKYTYLDFPSFSPSLANEVTYFNGANIIILIFKDSTSFTELFEFLEKLTKITVSNTTQNRYIWQDIQLIFIIYNNYEQTTAVQTQQIFKILKDEVRNFNEVAQISTLIWDIQDKSAAAIKSIIQRIQLSKKTDLMHSNQEINNVPTVDEPRQVNQQELTGIAAQSQQVQSQGAIKDELKQTVSIKQQEQKYQISDKIQPPSILPQNSSYLEKQPQIHQQPTSQNDKQRQISIQIPVQQQLIYENTKIQQIQQASNQQSNTEPILQEAEQQQVKPDVIQQPKLQQKQQLDLLPKSEQQKQLNSSPEYQSNLPESKDVDNQPELKVSITHETKEFIKVQQNYMSLKNKTVSSQQDKGLKNKGCTCQVM